MEAKRCSQRWKTHLPEFKHSRRCLSPPTRGKTETESDGGGAHKSVTLASTSRYLTDRQYVMRKPLFSAEQHASILKKTYPQRRTEKEKHLGVSRREEDPQRTAMTRARGEMTPESFALSHSGSSPPAASREDLSPPLGISELSGWLGHEEPTFGSPFPGSRSAQQSLSGSILEVQRLNPPRRPRLTSTVLHPTYTPRSGYSRSGRTQLRLGGARERGGGETKLCSSEAHSKGHPVSPYQANYWACAIPKALPPSPDRHVAGWDPNREYQALLDYTYPLRPGQAVSERDSSELQGDSLLQTDPNLQDSGIELDHLCSSTRLSGLGFAVSGTGLSRERSTLSVGRRSPDRQGFTKSSGGLRSAAMLSRTDPAGLSWNGPDCSKDRGGMRRYQSDGHRYQHRAPSSSTSTAFIRSTSVLPQARCVWGEVDEEFWPLPEQLEELQLLSRQVREVTAQLSRPVTARWDSLGPGSNSILPSIPLPEKQEAEAKEPDGNDQGKDETGREERSAAHTAADRRDSEAAKRGSGAWAEPVGGGLSRSGLREVEALVEQLCGGPTLPGSHEDPEQSDSLMQHIQVFCSHLGQLIQRLHTASEKMELLAAPTVDVDGVKSSLADYQGFQRDACSHRPLAACVLHAGRLLLSCIDATSPLLRDALLLIERRAGALEAHTEHCFSSILAAMDSLSQPSPVQQSREEDPGPAGVQGSTV